jgi:hypothetical protein
VLNFFRRFLNRFEQLRAAGLASTRAQALESGAQLGPFVRKIVELFRLDDDRVQGELGMAEKLLHESAGTKLKRSRSLVGDEKRDAKRNLGGRDAGYGTTPAALLDFEVGGLHIRD